MQISPQLGRIRRFPVPDCRWWRLVRTAWRLDRASLLALPHLREAA
ncbi:MAG: hypothetical protein AB2693_09505 [Candidatus Thiodiazotropha sp.]